MVIENILNLLLGLGLLGFIGFIWSIIIHTIDKKTDPEYEPKPKRAR